MRNGEASATAGRFLISTARSAGMRLTAAQPAMKPSSAAPLTSGGVRLQAQAAGAKAMKCVPVEPSTALAEFLEAPARARITPTAAVASR